MHTTSAFPSSAALANQLQRLVFASGTIFRDKSNQFFRSWSPLSDHAQLSALDDVLDADCITHTFTTMRPSSSTGVGLQFRRVQARA